MTVFTGQRILIVGLIEIALPDTTVRLTDGGFLNWAGRGLFRAKHDDFGAVESVDGVTEQMADQAPGGTLTLLPTDITAASALLRADASGVPIRFWLGQANHADGAMVGTPHQLFEGQVDAIRLRVGRQSRHLDIDFVCDAERLFMTREGNVLSTRFHQEAWPGEQGFDHCTGVQGGVPWGAPDPARGAWSTGDMLRSQGGIFS